VTIEPMTVDAAIAAFRSGDAAGAIRGLSRRVDADPADGAAWHALGLVAGQTGDAHLALRALRRAAAVLPLDPAPYEDLATAYASGGAPELAFDCRRSAQALAQAPDALAEAAAAGRHHEVLHEALRRVAAGDGDVRLHYHIALARQAFNEIDDVIAHLKIVTRRLPACAGAFLALGDYLHHAARLERIASEFRQRVTGGAPGEAADRLAGEAEASYRRALVLDPDDAHSHAALGNLLMDTGRGEDALGHYQSAAALAPDDAILRFNLAIGLERLGRFAEACAAAERTIALEAAFGEAHACRARCLVALGNHVEAAASFDRVLECAPTMSTLAYFRVTR
jgi:tetratricopeptide (TPR) repeat protein